MNTSIIEGDGRPTWVAATLTKTLVPFHGVLIFAVVRRDVLELAVAEGREDGKKAKSFLVLISTRNQNLKHHQVGQLKLDTSPFAAA